MVSLAAASLIATTAMAADKGIDIVTTGQAVVYYQTAQNNGTNAPDMFNDQSSNANVGLQLNLDADLKNNFTFGSQLTYLGTAGLNKNLVGDTRVMQIGGNTPATQTLGASDTASQIALTQIFVAKKIANTTVKIGRQELPQSLSPFAYSEGWNVFKNTFDAILVVNSDIPDTTVVAAYVSGGTGINLNQTGDMITTVRNSDNNATINPAVDGTAYMLTVQNKSIPMTTATISYYNVAKIGYAVATNDSFEGANVVWGDVAVASKDLPMGLKFGLQGGTIMAEHKDIADTTAFGLRAGMAPVEGLDLCLAFTSVDGDKNKHQVAIKNLGTGIKSPLYTQMIANQDAISLDADTFTLKAAYNTGDYGTISAQFGMTTAGNKNLINHNDKKNDYNEFDLAYTIKAGGVDYLAAYVFQSYSEKNIVKMDNNNIVRLWARYNF